MSFPISAFASSSPNEIQKYYQQRSRLWGSENIGKKIILEMTNAPPPVSKTGKHHQESFDQEHVFSLFEDLILMTPRSWYEISPREFAVYDAHVLFQKLCSQTLKNHAGDSAPTCSLLFSICDLFCGVGGSTTAFATCTSYFDLVVGVDNDPVAISAARNNAKIFDTMIISKSKNQAPENKNKITTRSWCVADVEKILFHLKKESLAANNSEDFDRNGGNSNENNDMMVTSENFTKKYKFDCFYISPPWGGTQYRQNFSFVPLLSPATPILLLETSLEIAIRQNAKIIACYLPVQVSVVEYLQVFSKVLHKVDSFERITFFKRGSSNNNTSTVGKYFCGKCCGARKNCDEYFLKGEHLLDVEVVVHVINERSKAMTIFVSVPRKEEHASLNEKVGRRERE